MDNNNKRLSSLLYRLRWPLSALVLSTIFFCLVAGLLRVDGFSGRVDSLDDGNAAAASLSPSKLFDARYDIWFDPTDSGLKLYKAIEEQFIAEDSVIIAFEDQNDPMGVFGPTALGAVWRLTKAIERIPHVRDVRSLTASPWARWGEIDGTEEGLNITDLFDESPDSYSKDEVIVRMVAVLGGDAAIRLVGENAVKRAVSAPEDNKGEPRFINSIVTPDGRSAALVVQLVRPKVSSERLNEVFGDDQQLKAAAASMHQNEAQFEALDAIREVVRKESSYDFHIVGMTAYEQRLMTAGLADIKWVGAMFVCIALLLLAVYRRVSAVGLPVMIVFLAIMGMEGVVLFAGDLANNLTAMAPTMVVAIGIADSVHLVTSNFLLRPSYSTKKDLTVAVIDKNALPIFLTSVTTAVGFFSLLASDIIPIRMLGYTAGIGTVFAYLLSMTLLPALLSLLPVSAATLEKDRVVAQNQRFNRVVQRLVRFVIRNRARVAIGSLLLVALSAFGLSMIEVNNDYRKYFRSTDPFIEDISWFEQRFGGTGDLEITFHGSPSGDDLGQVQARQTRLEELEIKQLLHEKDPLNAELSEDEKQEHLRLAKLETDYQRGRIALSPPFLELVDRFEQRLVSESKDASSPLSILSKTESALDVLRGINRAQHKNSPSHYRIPTLEDVDPEAREPTILYDDIMDEATLIPGQTGATIAEQYYFQYENGAKPAQNLLTLVPISRRGFRIAARIQYAPATFMQAGFAMIRELAATEYGQIGGTAADVANGKALATVSLTGKLFLYINMIQTFTHGLINSFIIAIIAITILITIIYRSVVLGLISIIPNVLPLVLPLGLFGLLHEPITAPAIMVVAIALGVCVDDTIHLFTQFRQGLDQGLSTNEALEHAFEEVGTALTLTSVLLSAGFFVLYASDFRPNAIIGVMGAVMIALAWLADFIITPALLSFVRPKKQRGQSDKGV